MKYNGTVDEHGKLHVIHRKNFDREIIDEFKAKAGKKTTVIIEVKKKRPYKTLSQNAYLWSVCIPLAMERLRETTGEMNIGKEHTFEFIMTQVHFTEVVNEGTGEVVRMRKETHNLTIGEYAELIDDVINWCDMMLDIKIPPPNSQSMLDFEKAENEWNS